MYLRTQKTRQLVAFGLLLVFFASIPVHHCHCDCLVLNSHDGQACTCCSQLNDLSVPHFCIESKVFDQQPHRKPSCPHCINKRLGYLPLPKIDGPKADTSTAFADAFPSLITWHKTASLTFCFKLSHSPPTACRFHSRI